MDYMQKAADLVADAKTIEKLDEQTKEQEREEERVRALGGITIEELKDRFCKLNREGAASETAVIVFKPESFPDREYTVEERSYRVSSDNKMFNPGMCGYSLFGICLANSDECERLDYHMRGYEGPRWIVDYCRLEA